MQTYKTFRPTQFDHHISVDSKEEWLVLPCARNRDSDCLQESNFHATLQEMGGESETVEVHRFGHWANGWFEIILVKPDTQAHQVAEKIEAALDNYPILDESDLSERETEAANQVWEHNFRPKERIDYIRKHRSQFEFQNLHEMLSCVRGKHFAGYPSDLLG